MKPYVLVVEPYEDLRTTLCLFLKHHGFRVETAENEAEAEAWAEREPPHAVIVELVLERATRSLLDRLRARANDDLCVVITSNGRADEEEAARASGLAVLPKPFRPALVLEHLERCNVPRANR